MKKSNEDTQKIPIIRPEDYEQNTNKVKNNKETHISSERSSNQTTKQRNGKIKNTITSLILTLTVLFLLISIGLYSAFSRVNYQPIQNDINISIENITHRVYNILLIGTDKEDNGNSRSDSMIMISIDKNSKQIKMISFMRDLWVEIPDNDSGRLNSAFTKGAAGLLIETIEYNFDIHIDNYILVDFEMFKQLIDELGGITVEIAEKEAEFINRTTKATVKPGKNTINGYEALIYCRIRKLDSDFMRTQRQRKVINAIIDKIRNQNIINTASAGFNILPLITTDISPVKMIYKSLGTVSAINYDVEQLRIPADNTYSNKTIKSQAVLVADIDKNKEMIHEFIYN